jgi:hypothetical protein
MKWTVQGVKDKRKASSTSLVDHAALVYNPGVDSFREHSPGPILGKEKGLSVCLTVILLPVFLQLRNIEL